MKNMKRLLIVTISFYLLTSCVSTHNGTMSSSSIGRTVRYEDIAYGVSQSNKYFGLGGASQDALVLEAKRVLIKNRSLRPNEEYANFTIDFKRTYWPFYSQTKVTVSADVVRFTNDTISEAYTENYKNKLLGKSIINGLFNIGDSIFDKNLKGGTILSFEGSDIVRVLYKTKMDKIRTKKMSINNIYTKKKSYNGLKAGEWYGYSQELQGTETPIATKIIAVGLESFIIMDKKNSLEILKYNK